MERFRGLVLVIAVAHSLAHSSSAAQSLQPLLYRSYPLGSINCSGWIRQQLVLTANGQAGHLELFWDDVMDSVWIGGHHDNSGAGHERGPYWLNGVVPLAAHLDASGDTHETTLAVDLQAQVGMWIAYILEHQCPNGWLGPDDGFGGVGNTYWSGWNIASALLQYADAQKHSGNNPQIAQKCEQAVLRYILEVNRRMHVNATATWSQMRWQDYVALVHQLIDQAPQGQQAVLLETAQLAYNQSWDWDAYYAQTGIGSSGAYVGKPVPAFPEGDIPGYWNLYDHGVNNAMATKGPSVWFRQTGDTKQIPKTRTRIEMQDQYHGQPHGMFAADECFAGRALNRGTELCTVVEQMHSLTMAFKALGDLFLLERVERIAYNALPGTLDPEQWRHQYLQQPNEINALFDRNNRDRPWKSDHGDATGFGLEPNFGVSSEAASILQRCAAGCCTANFVQGWAKLVTDGLVLRSERDGGVLVAILAPARLVYDTMSLTVDTQYPFGDNATIQINNAADTSIPLHVRIPAWATNASVAVAGAGAQQRAPNGTLFSVTCGARSNLTLVLELNPVIRVETGWGQLARSQSGAVLPATNAAAVLRGPLLYTIPLQQIDTVVKTYAPFGLTDLAMTSTTEWNFALDLENPSMEFLPTGAGPNGELPFNTSNYSAVIRVAVRQLPGWGERRNAADEPPPSPINCSNVGSGCGPRLFINMVPYGSTNLRMAGLPWIAPSSLFPQA